MDRIAFFAALRRRERGVSGTSLKQGQVDGITAILDEAERRGTRTNDLAYAMATVYHETSRTMQPVMETLADNVDTAIARLEKAWKAGKLKWVKTPYWRKDDNGKSWLGRGLVQLTHPWSAFALRTSGPVRSAGGTGRAVPEMQKTRSSYGGPDRVFRHVESADSMCALK